LKVNTLNIDTAYFIISIEKDMKPVAAELNARFIKGKQIWSPEKKVKTKMCYLAIMNEVFNTAQNTKSDYIETYSKYLKDWIEAIAFYSDDL